MEVDTRDLRYFLAISEELNISRAAKRLFISQPLLSQRLARLEEQLGTRLVRRVRTGVALTAAGMALVPFAERVTDDWRKTLALISAHAAQEEDTVVLGLSVPTPSTLVIESSEGLRGADENARLVTRRPPWSDPTGGLADGTVDIALIRLPMGQPSGLTSRVVARTPVVALLPRSHHLAPRGSLRFADIEDEPILTPPQVSGPPYDVAVGQTLRIRVPRTVVAVNSWAELIDAVYAGNGIALVPAYAVGESLVAMTILPVADVPAVETALAWRVSGNRDIVRTAIPIIRQAAERSLELSPWHKDPA
jgi:DNA-binding transcriptional LysR family regulator